MSHHQPLDRSERLPLLALLGLVILSVAAIFISQTTESGLQVRTVPDWLETRSVVFTDGDDGQVIAIDADTEETVMTFSSGEGGFARTALRALAYSRRLEGVGARVPFIVARAEDGQIILHDPATDKSIGISAFGQANIEQFAQLLPNEASRP